LFSLFPPSTSHLARHMPFPVAFQSTRLLVLPLLDFHPRGTFDGLPPFPWIFYKPAPNNLLPPFLFLSHIPAAVLLGTPQGCSQASDLGPPGFHYHHQVPIPFRSAFALVRFPLFPAALCRHRSTTPLPPFVPNPAIHSSYYISWSFFCRTPAPSLHVKLEATS